MQAWFHEQLYRPVDNGGFYRLDSVDLAQFSLRWHETVDEVQSNESSIFYREWW